jgi:hypothetical protein
LTAVRSGIDGVIESVIAAQHVLEMHHRALLIDAARTQLARVTNRLSKIVAEAWNLSAA